jgi:hypothetical protein
LPVGIAYKNLIAQWKDIIEEEVMGCISQLVRLEKFICITFLKSNMGNDGTRFILSHILSAVHSLK